MSRGDSKRGWRLSPLWYCCAAYILFLLPLPVVFAQPTDWFQASVVKTELNVSSSVSLVPSGPNPLVESLRADVIFVPLNTEFQAVRRFDAVPSAIVSADRVRYEWLNPSGRLSYGYSSIVEVANNAPHVTAEIPYPVKVPQGFEKYVKPTRLIDSSNPAIIGQAHKLALGEDDLFVVVVKIASWTKNNVDYNLSTLTAEISQPASWVLENRYGVCDEITGLFIAMLRSLNIPARFVSGMAFTSSPQFPQGWGAHGWAEVYFPGVGWVPFDPTFGEFGWVDPGHIKLKESLDPEEPTTLFEWKARDVEVEVEDLHLSASIVEAKGLAPSELRVNAYPLRSRVGFGSYNGIVVDIENLADYYVGVEFVLSRVNDMVIFDGEYRQAVLPPGGRGRVMWKVRVKENLDPNFQYEIPIQISNVKSEVARSSFVSGKWDVVFSAADVDASFERLSVSQRDDFDLACVLEKDMVWDEQGRVDCVLQSNVEKDLLSKVCFTDCSSLVVPAGGSVPVSFDIPLGSPGAHEVLVTASAGGLEKRAVLTLVRLDVSRVVVKNVVAPESVNYGENFDLSFTLSRESISSPEKVSVEVKGGGARAVLDIGDLSVDQEVHVNVASSQLYVSNPVFSIDVEFEDSQGGRHSASGEARTRVVGVPWYKKLVGWFVALF